MNKIRIGVIGLGRLGFKHAENIEHIVRGADLSAVCSISEEELVLARNELAITNCYTDYGEMLEKAKLDAVAIVSSSNMHCEHTLQALEKGLHVFCEKPIGISHEECLKVEEATKANPELVYMPGFMRRYDSSYIYAKKKIDEGYIGKPILFRGYSVDPESAIEGALKYAANSAGQFLDMAVHDIDLARWFLDSEPKSIYAIGGCFAHSEYAQYGDGDNVSALMQFDNDSMAFILAGRTAAHGYNVETEIVGTKATLRIASVPQKNMVELIDNSGVRQECSQSFQERFQEAFVNEIQEFVDCIAEGRLPEIKAEDGTRSTVIAELATQSFKQNKLIKID
ncbi:MAG: myo-inositol 2-dehydrogenase/D-chiro-inositol 1-dehydrogenase [Cyclobacteriaceae bacterium]|jgi:myo-inositol 2-dehydrogenase/D-chiro-inositol 1-dehydrogenase